MQFRKTAAKSNSGRIISSFRADKIRAPFTVNLIESVEELFNVKNAQNEHHIPDLQDLLYSIVLYRVLDSIIMTGSDVKFLRKSLGLRAFEVSKMLSISREHYSRCENDNVPMSNSLETLIRVFILSKISAKLGVRMNYRDMTFQTGIDMIFDISNSYKKSDRYGDIVLNLRRIPVISNIHVGACLPMIFAWIKTDLQKEIHE